MNYYRRFMGDYLCDTGHLSLAEHGAYTVLLDHYYSRRCPLPASLEALYRLCRASTTSEREAVKAVADEFLRLAEDGLRHNTRADKELADWEARAGRNREVGKLGGRPRKEPRNNPDGFNSETQQEPRNNPDGYSLGSQIETQKKPSPSPSPSPSPESGVSSGDSRPRRRTGPSSFHREVIEAYHELLSDLPRVKVWSKKRGQALDARARERCQDGKPADKPDYWRALFREVAASDFLCGRATDFRADLEWLLRPENFAKVIEGRYAPRASANGRGEHAR